MRYKIAPPPQSLSDLQQARAAVPLVPDSQTDCCLSVQQATAIDDRERARQYLTFLRALGLVATTERGYYRTQHDFDIERLRMAYRNNVFLVTELCTAATDDPDEAFHAVRDEIPRWERERHHDWEATWRERIGYLIEWGRVFGCEQLTPAERQ